MSTGNRMNDDDSNTDVDSPVKLTPHTCRLLKLIQSAPVEHAREAAQMLGRICSHSAPEVMWEILGRLVLLLSSKEWATRENASLAMHVVARNVPLCDQKQFLSERSIIGKSDADCQEDNISKQDRDSNYIWLTLVNVKESMSQIIDHGDTLLARSADHCSLKFVEDPSEDVSCRMKRQRMILAKRLGLSVALDSAGETTNKLINTHDIKINEESLSAAIERRRRKRKANQMEESNRCNVFKSLLLNSFKNLDSREKNRNNIGSAAISHRTAQNVLATELIFNSMGDQWYVRHGAILGALELFKAWSCSEETILRGQQEGIDSFSWGAWPEDVLCRCIGILCLDQFNDFAHHTYISSYEFHENSREATDIDALTCSTAPVREGAAQLLAHLHCRIPDMNRKAVLWDIIILLYDYKNDRAKERFSHWYRMHSSLIAIKYLLIVTRDIPINVRKKLPSILIDALSKNQKHEIVMEAAAILIINRHFKLIERNQLISLLTLHISKMEAYSSHASNCLNLLALTIKSNYVDPSLRGNVVLKLVSFLDYQNVAMRHTVLRCLTYLVGENMTPDERACILTTIFTLDLEFQESVQHLWHCLTTCDHRGEVPNEITNKIVQSYLGINIEKNVAIVDFRSKLLIRLMQTNLCLPNLILLTLLSRDYQESALFLLAKCLDDESENFKRHLSFIVKDVIQYMLENRDCCFNISTQTFNHLLNNLHTLEFSKLQLLVKSLKIPKPTKEIRKVDISGIRVENMMSCCVLKTIDLESSTKLTPFIRPLMTFLKNDTCKLRGYHTSDALNRVLKKVNKKEVRQKIIKNLVNLYLKKNSGNVKVCLRGLVLAENRNRDILNHFYLSETNVTALRILIAVVPDSNVDLDMTVLSFFKEQFIWVLDWIIGKGDLLAHECFVKLAQIDVDSAIIEIKKRYQESPTVIVKLLEGLVEANGTALLSHMTWLVGFALGQLANGAAQLFHKLIVLAPLVTFEVEAVRPREENKAEKLIKHLIHGKALSTNDNTMNVHLKDDNMNLRSYQKEAVSWLRFLNSIGCSGACIADEMGLGKTLTALSSVMSCTNQNDQNGLNSNLHLVICPATLLRHWQNECDHYFGPSKIIIYESLEDYQKADQVPSTEMQHIIIVSYATIRRKIDEYCIKRWNFVVLDEGHLIRNARTATAKAVFQLAHCSRFRIILSGTPIQNSIQELYVLFEFIMPGYLASSQVEFWDKFGRDIYKSQQNGANANQIQLGHSKLKSLHQAVLPFILRREKHAVLKDLPPKIISDISVQMSSLQQSLYQHIVSTGGDTLSYALKLIGNPSKRKDLDWLMRKDVQNASCENSCEKSKPHSILKMLLHLRLLCTHPSLVCHHYCKETNINDSVLMNHISVSGKFVALLELLRGMNLQGCEAPCIEAGVDGDETNIYLSQHNEDDTDFDNEEVSTLDRVHESDVINNATITETGDKSDAKYNKKCLIFAQYKQSLDALERYLLHPHLPSLRYLRMDNSLSVKQRGDVVAKFNGDPSIKALLLTTKVGGLGLNLTSASIVIFLECDWNPFVDLQAMDRVHRLGQTSQSVNVYRILSRDSVEEQIMRVQNVKRDMGNAIVNTDNSSMYSMGTENLLDFFTVAEEASISEPNEDDISSSHGKPSSGHNLSREKGTFSVSKFLSDL